MQKKYKWLISLLVVFSVIALAYVENRKKKLKEEFESLRKWLVKDYQKFLKVKSQFGDLKSVSDLRHASLMEKARTLEVANGYNVYCGMVENGTTVEEEAYANARWLMENPRKRSKWLLNLALK